ncbi:putative electron transfer flavoprotein subunit [Chytriomyces hyalinus]|nr:putative electron transfer flavoprotein subunit [Chytriomyces hyalinus]
MSPAAVNHTPISSTSPSSAGTVYSPTPTPQSSVDEALIATFLSQYPQLHRAFLRSLESASLPDLPVLPTPGCSMAGTVVSMASISGNEEPSLKEESATESIFSDLELVQSPAPSEDSYCEEPLPKRRTPTIKYNQHRCANCDTTVASRWRRDDEGQRVCNACGVYFRLYGRKRVVAKTAKVVKRRNRSAKESPLSDSE